MEHNGVAHLEFRGLLPSWVQHCGSVGHEVHSEQLAACTLSHRIFVASHLRVPCASCAFVKASLGFAAASGRSAKRGPSAKAVFVRLGSQTTTEAWFVSHSWPGYREASNSLGFCQWQVGLLPPALLEAPGCEDLERGIWVRLKSLGYLDSRYVTGSRASFRDIGFVTKPFCLRQAVRDKPPRQASATSQAPSWNCMGFASLFHDSAKQPRQTPRHTYETSRRDIRM